MDWREVIACDRDDALDRVVQAARRLAPPREGTPR